jgi:hypothetical protein
VIKARLAYRSHKREIVSILLQRGAMSPGGRGRTGGVPAEGQGKHAKLSKTGLSRG